MNENMPEPSKKTTVPPPIKNDNMIEEIMHAHGELGRAFEDFRNAAHTQTEQLLRQIIDLKDELAKKDQIISTLLIKEANAKR